VPALCYIVDRGPSAICGAAFAGRPIAPRPPGTWYVGSEPRLCVATVAALEQLGYRDAQLHRWRSGSGRRDSRADPIRIASAMAHVGDGLSSPVPGTDTGSRKVLLTFF